MDFSTLASASFLSREDRKAYLTAMQREATTAQRKAYNEGRSDRNAGKPMREAWTMSPAISNHYTNGYRDASTGR